MDGDLNQDGRLDEADIMMFCELKAEGNRAIDFSGDEQINDQDLRLFLRHGLGTVVGDANLDGLFDSGDIVQVFRTGEYEDGTQGNSTWSEGDWNCSGDFGSDDLVFAFQSGSFVAAARPESRARDVVFRDW